MVHWKALGVSAAAIYAAKIYNGDNETVADRLQCSGLVGVTLHFP